MKNSKNDSVYSKWLSNLAGDRKLFKELTDEEVYSIMLKAAEITYSRNQVLNQDHPYEEAVSIIYSELLSRDYEKTEDFNSENIPYYDENTGKYSMNWKPRKENWRKRENCRGFQYFKDSNMTIVYFSNTIFRVFDYHIKGVTRTAWFKNIYYNTDSFESNITCNVEGKSKLISDVIEDDKSNFDYKETESCTYINQLANEISDIAEDSDYSIKIGKEIRALSYGNLLYLYDYLSEGKRVSSVEVLKHIIYKGKEIVEDSNIRYINRFISSFKKYLLESGTVDIGTYIGRRGKEVKCYGFVE